MHFSVKNSFVMVFIVVVFVILIDTQFDLTVLLLGILFDGTLKEESAILILGGLVAVLGHGGPLRLRRLPKRKQLVIPTQFLIFDSSAEGKANDKDDARTFARATTTLSQFPRSSTSKRACGRGSRLTRTCGTLGGINSDGSPLRH